MNLMDEFRQKKARNGLPFHFFKQFCRKLKKMAITFIPLANQKTSTWFGGNTTEILLLPENSSYLSRDFDLRISRASIEIEDSNFTSLPDFQRWIMLLSGSIELYHSNSLARVLKPFEVYAFDGGETTKSIGLAKDFNVMIRKNSGSVLIEKIDIKTNEELNLSAKNSMFILCLHGEFSCNNYQLTSEDAIFSQNDDFTIKCKSNSSFVLCRFSKY